MCVSFSQNVPLMGSLDLGGASAEIAFQYQPHGTPQSEYEVTVELFGKQHNLYARSYLCYGQNEAKWRLLAHLIHVRRRERGGEKAGREERRKGERRRRRGRKGGGEEEEEEEEEERR